jgi:hypothetical protein
MSSIAVFLVLGGATAIAAGQLGKNTVGSKQLKKNAVTTAKIKNGAVTGAKVKPGSLKASNFAAGQLPAGPKGDKGDTGPTFGAFAEGGCGSLDGSFEPCPSTGPVNLPASGRVLLIASLEWDNDNDGLDPNSGECQLSVDGNALEPEVHFGENLEVHTIGESGSVSINHMTSALPAGSHSFALECLENDGAVFVNESMLSVVLLGNS